uniref:Uncharacterized protein n=1 Tax=viral metagenome TaxID=1070528 RepID=A0A6M3JKB3_9ZZZZ
MEIKKKEKESKEIHPVWSTQHLASLLVDGKIDKATFQRIDEISSIDERMKAIKEALNG